MVSYVGSCFSVLSKCRFYFAEFLILKLENTQSRQTGIETTANYLEGCI